ncbi:NADH-quinone oxidoreductase subunit C [Methylocystis bryophila]|uniref:Hydrogenase expression protein HypE n=1 Tax=Methylocystis bryophila TaxID=655015 RepID=A0A1W6MUL1_9HYPH|nr:NADH-quinone oxidoreductase subunit C [Methylocystis bryophila]ARN81262.1 hydrogenase expression protein HypE [Methylocystis bryophila]BDV37217.1 hydrogenase expression protein HypE [Methylocystis bryophila]
MMSLRETMRSGRQAGPSTPWARHVVDQTGWLRAIREISKGQGDLLSLWSDGAEVHMAILDHESREIGIVSFECPEGRFPSVAHLHPPAMRLERTIQDIYGLVAQSLPDARPWLDHGRWGLRRPGRDPQSSEPTGAAYEFLSAEGAPLHQIPVGPVHAGVIEPGHFRFSANGELVVRLEERLGYVHKGIEQLMAGASLERATRLAGRVSGDSTVAYSLAFAQAVESALGVEIPRRAVWLRAQMAELERLANHIGDIGAICNDASFSLMHAHCGVLRERILRAANACFGHRLMMDKIVPGGVASDLSGEGYVALLALLPYAKKLIPNLVRLYGDTTSLQDRTVGAGKLRAELARQYACGGYIGRASGRAFDARRFPGYAPYSELPFELGASEDEDVDARVWVRFDEIRASLPLIEKILDRLPDGEIRTEIPHPPETREGAALVEGFRGDIFVWARLDPSGAVARCHLRDPSWFQWPLLEAAIEGNIVADFPLINKSFNCSYSGQDL